MKLDKAKTCVTEALPTCPCGKLLDEGQIVCPSCAPAYVAGWAARGKRDAEVIEVVKRRVEYQRMVCGNCADLIAEAIERED